MKVTLLQGFLVILLISPVLSERFCFGDSVYVSRDSVHLKDLLPHPPLQTSIQTKNEIDEILNYQNTRSKTAVNFAIDDQNIDVFRFSTVLGSEFNRAKMPVTFVFFNRVIENERMIIFPLKHFWKRPRPYVYDKRVRPCVRIPLDFSYPSNHSAAGNLMAIILARMIPEKNDELLRRGREFAENRVIGGVHYRSDIEGGKIAAEYIAAKLFGNKEFIKDFHKSQKEVRQILGLKPLQ